MKSQYRFLGLDVLRGCLAIAVVLHHYFQLAGFPYMGSAWLAVDAFFILSGLVLGVSYEEKIKRGLTFKQFLVGRLVRLYPSYFIGLLIGVFVFFYTDKLNLAPSDWFGRLFTSFLLLPFPVPLGVDGSYLTPVFLFNDPAWSLFFEIFINLIFFFYISSFSKHLKPFLLILFTVGLVVSMVCLGLSNGFSAENFLGGFFRVGFFFFLGFYIYKLPLKKWRGSYFSSFFLLFLLLIIFNLRNYYALFLGLFALIPLTVISFYLIENPSGDFCLKFAELIGDISYPLYIIHYPLFKLITAFVNTNGVITVIDIFGLTVLAIGFSLFLSKVELRLRAFFSKIFIFVFRTDLKH